ncbi:11S GLOBULIN SEED STORAGE PROTEIN 2-LIKE [Salix koriyanagi]|uniref:11S GLOBULIN SEED STORAGE PROTEIN 2-LIKE n=1 Tax=Salix koriyanagi TaxID=2511006 RepID=A0A9Q0P3Y0_9ROSI|nr:11S GLOBULIN SEED STORAGE PROTEIN 2-LIKE [Salix koriyanagi]
MTDNRVVYALRGELNAQIVDERGNTIMNERVREGEMFVIPQFYATLMRAGNNGFEWVSFKIKQPANEEPYGWFHFRDEGHAH